MNPIPYRIARIETLQFALFPEKYINGQDVMINTNVSFGHKSDLSQIRNTLSIQYVQENNLLLLLNINCYYDIAPEGISEINNEGKIPVDFLRYMATISVGAARGIIHEKTEGSVLNPVVLPPVNLVETIKEDLYITK